MKDFYYCKSLSPHYSVNCGNVYMHFLKIDIYIKKEIYWSGEIKCLPFDVFFFPLKINTQSIHWNSKICKEININ